MKHKYPLDLLDLLDQALKENRKIRLIIVRRPLTDEHQKMLADLIEKGGKIRKETHG